MLREPVGSIGKRLVTGLIAGPIVVLFLSAFFGVRWAVVLGLIALMFVFVLAKDSLAAALRWNRPALEIASTPYALGSAPTVVYRRKPKRVVDISSCTIECQLVCEEEVTYTQGTDRTTDSRRVYESNTVGTGEGTADGLVAQVVLDISANLGSPSFSLPSNKVSWYAEVSVSGSRLPRDSHRFLIDVAAVLDPRHRVQVQDT